MAQKKVWFGSLGPFLYDDETVAAGLNRKGLRAEGGLLLLALVDPNVDSDRITFYHPDITPESFGTIYGYYDLGTSETFIRMGADLEAGGILNHIEISSDDTVKFVTDLVAISTVLQLGQITSSGRDNLTPDPGWLIYNGDNNRFEFYNGTEWRAFSHTAV